MTLPVLPKSAWLLAALAASSSSCLASVTLQFSTVLDGVANNWANGAGVGGTSMPWGIVVDRDGDGLATSYSVAGVDFGRITSQGQSMPLQDAEGVDTDDVLFMA